MITFDYTSHTRWVEPYSRIQIDRISCFSKWINKMLMLISQTIATIAYCCYSSTQSQYNLLIINIHSRSIIHNLTNNNWYSQFTYRLLGELN